LVSWTYSYLLKDHVTSVAFKKYNPKFPEKKKELERLANSLNENDNPVLMLVKLR
jgi:tRNA(Phe) wybutosine-synthesizing methylase Tyw3